MDESNNTNETKNQDTTTPSRLGRVLLGFGLAAQASEDFRDMEDTIEYAKSAGVPAPNLAVPFASGMMIVAGTGIILWRLPRLSTGAAVTFLTVVTATMHDFWNADDEDKSGERLAFFGNLTMLGGALVLLKEAFQ